MLSLKQITQIFFIFFIFFLLVEYRYRITQFAVENHQFHPILIYSTLVFIVLSIRYIGSLFHFTNRWQAYRPKRWPSVDIIIPAYNEGAAIYTTVKSITECDYPKQKMNIVLINDGSTDDTWEYIQKAAKAFPTYPIKTIDLGKNMGKKEAMAAGIRATKSDYIVFIDSDSAIDRQCIKEIIRPLSKSEKIGAVSGHALVQNSNINLLTKMQEIRYFNAFRSAKALESLLGFVSCCPGCCSAYRRTALVPVMDAWLNQSFLGVKCTYGDDRSLTNLILKSNYQAVYNEKAVVYTIVPENIKKYNKQQIRWKKSWLRESIVVLSFVWKRNPLTAFLMIVDTITPFFTPVVIGYIFFYLAFVSHYNIFLYLIGIFLFASCMGLFYKIHNPSAKNWLKGALYSSLLSLLLIWQLPYALLTLRDAKWGTR